MDDIDREKITLDTILPSQRELAEVIGIDNYIDLVEYIDGDSIYIPKFDTLLANPTRIQRDEEIISKYDGSNLKQLAKEYGLCVRRMYSIIPRNIRRKYEKIENEEKKTDG